MLENGHTKDKPVGWTAQSVSERKKVVAAAVEAARESGREPVQFYLSYIEGGR